MKITLSRLAAICPTVLIALAVFPRVVLAQDYPSHAIHIIVPYGAAGSTDFVSRLYAKDLAEQLGQSVIIDNRPGASTNIGSEVAASAPPDGYTLLITDGAYRWNSVFGPVPPFNPSTALLPIAMIAKMPFVIAASPKKKFSTLKELIADARAAPGKYTISSASVRIFVELLNSKAKMELLHIPYKGGAQAISDAISGQVDMVYAALPALWPFIQSGQLKPLGVTSLKRSAAIPDVPTVAETGVDYDISIQYVVYAPAGTPAAIRDRLAAATEKIVAQKEFAQRLLAVGSETGPSTAAQLTDANRRELVMWQQVAKQLPDLVETK